MQNIKKRNYPYEENIAEDYLKLLNEVYNQYFINYDISPLLIINTDEIDFIITHSKIRRANSQIRTDALLITNDKI